MPDQICRVEDDNELSLFVDQPDDIDKTVADKASPEVNSGCAGKLVAKPRRINPSRDDSEAEPDGPLSEPSRSGVTVYHPTPNEYHQGTERPVVRLITSTIIEDGEIPAWGSWRKWTAISLTTLPSWCRTEYNQRRKGLLDIFEASGRSEEHARRLLPAWPPVLFGPTRKINSWQERAFYQPPAAKLTPSPASITGDSDWEKGAEREEHFRDLLAQFVPLPTPGSLDFVRALQRQVVKTAEKDETGGGGDYLIAPLDHPFLSVRLTLHVLNFPPFASATTSVPWRWLLRRSYARQGETLETALLEQIGRDVMVDLQDWASKNNERRMIPGLVRDCDLERLFDDIEETGGWYIGLADVDDQRYAQHEERWKMGSEIKRQHSAKVADLVRRGKEMAFPIFEVPDLSYLLARRTAQISSGIAAARKQTACHDASKDEKTEATEENEKDRMIEKKKHKQGLKMAQKKRAMLRKREQAAQTAKDAQKQSQEIWRSTNEGVESALRSEPRPKAAQAAEDLEEQIAIEQAAKILQQVSQDTTKSKGEGGGLLAQTSTAVNPAEPAGGHSLLRSADTADVSQPEMTRTTETCEEDSDVDARKTNRKAFAICQEDARPDGIETEGQHRPCEDNGDCARPTAGSEDCSFQNIASCTLQTVTTRVTDDRMPQGQGVGGETAASSNDSNVLDQEARLEQKAQSIPATASESAEKSIRAGKGVGIAPPTVSVREDQARVTASKQDSGPQEHADGITHKDAPKDDGGVRNESLDVLDTKSNDADIIEEAATPTASEAGDSASRCEDVGTDKVDTQDRARQPGPQSDTDTDTAHHADGVLPQGTQDAVHSRFEAERVENSNMPVDQSGLPDSGTSEADRASSVIDAGPSLQPAMTKSTSRQPVPVKLPPVAPALPNIELLQRLIRRKQGLPSPEQTYKVKPFGGCGLSETHPSLEGSQNEEIGTHQETKEPLQQEILLGSDVLYEQAHQQEAYEEVPEGETAAQVIFGFGLGEDRIEPGISDQQESHEKIPEVGSAAQVVDGAFLEPLKAEQHITNQQETDYEDLIDGALASQTVFGFFHEEDSDERDISNQQSDKAARLSTAPPSPKSLINNPIVLPVPKAPGQQRSASEGDIEPSHHSSPKVVDSEAQTPATRPRTLPRNHRVAERGPTDSRQLSELFAGQWSSEDPPVRDPNAMDHSSIWPPSSLHGDAGHSTSHPPLDAVKGFIRPLPQGSDDAMPDSRGAPTKHNPDYPPIEWNRDAAAFPRTNSSNELGCQPLLRSAKPRCQAPRPPNVKPRGRQLYQDSAPRHARGSGSDRSPEPFHPPAAIYSSGWEQGAGGPATNNFNTLDQWFVQGLHHPQALSPPVRQAPAYLPYEPVMHAPAAQSFLQPLVREPEGHSFSGQKLPPVFSSSEPQVGRGNGIELMNPFASDFIPSSAAQGRYVTPAPHADEAETTSVGTSTVAEPRLSARNAARPRGEQLLSSGETHPQPASSVVAKVNITSEYRSGSFVFFQQYNGIYHVKTCSSSPGPTGNGADHGAERRAEHDQ